MTNHASREIDTAQLPRKEGQSGYHQKRRYFYLRGTRESGADVSEADLQGRLSQVKRAEGSQEELKLAIADVDIEQAEGKKAAHLVGKVRAISSSDGGLAPQDAEAVFVGLQLIATT